MQVTDPDLAGLSHLWALALDAPNEVASEVRSPPSMTPCSGVPREDTNWGAEPSRVRFARASQYQGHTDGIDSHS